MIIGAGRSGKSSLGRWLDQEAAAWDSTAQEAAAGNSAARRGTAGDSAGWRAAAGNLWSRRTPALVYRGNRVADLFSVGASSHIEEGAHRIGPASFHCEGRVVDSRRVDDGLRASGLGDDVHVFSVGKRRVAARKGEFYGCRLAATRQNRGCGDDRKGLFHGFEG